MQGLDRLLEQCNVPSLRASERAVNVCYRDGEGVIVGAIIEFRSSAVSIVVQGVRPERADEPVVDRRRKLRDVRNVVLVRYALRIELADSFDEFRGAVNASLEAELRSARRRV